MELLAGYGSASEDGNETQEQPKLLSLGSALSIRAAPPVSESLDARSQVVTVRDSQVFTNPTYQNLWKPEQGPTPPWGLSVARGQKNILTGFVQDEAINDFVFEQQHHLFQSTGIAVDPTEKNRVIVAIEEKKKKRKSPSEATSTTTTTATATDEKGVNPAAEEEAEVPPKKKLKIADLEELEVVFHSPLVPDYQGRTWLAPPSHLKPNPDAKCYLPKKVIHTWSGHSKGVSKISFFPKYGHLLLSGSNDATVKIWDVYGKRRCLATYYAHTKGVKDVNWSPNGERIVSCGYDKYTRVFDTTTGKCLAALTRNQNVYCAVFWPKNDNIILVGQSDKKILQWDVRAKHVVQEYDRHLGAINTITFVENDHYFITTSDDKSLRRWEYDIGAELKYIAEPHMHAIPAVSKTYDGKWLLCQSMDNQILVYGTRDKFKINNKKTFKGHINAGYAIGLDSSPDGQYVVSGTTNGGLWFWSWKTTKVLLKLNAHKGVTIDCKWHPIETSKVASASWDGTIKLWD